MGYFLGIDLGASSGRHIVGYDDLGVYKTVEVYRFENQFKNINGHLVWDLEYLFIEVIRGIRKSMNLEKLIVYQLIHGVVIMF